SLSVLGIAAPAVPPEPGAVPVWPGGGHLGHHETEPQGHLTPDLRAEAETPSPEPTSALSSWCVPFALPGTGPLLVRPLAAACRPRKALLPFGPLLSPALACLLPNIVLQCGLPAPPSPSPRAERGDPAGGSPPVPLPTPGQPRHPLLLPGDEALAVRLRPTARAQAGAG
ncbi:hypothetical protein chiPu_0033850, partial [Chiloscyllium punctatum]|nr:hypothetical protein [Chiloscyllium punctatum]